RHERFTVRHRGPRRDRRHLPEFDFAAPVRTQLRQLTIRCVRADLKTGSLVSDYGGSDVEFRLGTGTHFRTIRREAPGFYGPTEVVGHTRSHPAGSAAPQP